ncbi:hypothetical protein [Streptomyces sp. NPDC001889]
MGAPGAAGRGAHRSPPSGDAGGALREPAGGPPDGLLPIPTLGELRSVIARAASLNLARATRRALESRPARGADGTAGGRDG